MRIGFVGCGAIGSCYASYLSRKHEVCVLDTYAPVIESIKKNGILLDECAPGSGTGETVSFRPAMATTDPKEIGVVDLLIVFVHYQYLEAAVRNALPMIDRHTMILCLQNGLGNYDEIAKVVPEEQIIIGNTAFGATPMEPGHVKHTGTGVTNMGSLKAPKENVERMAEALREAGLEVCVHENVMNAIWHKLLANVAINGMSALLETKNGFVDGNQYAHEAARMLVEEAITVANACGCTLDHDAELEHAYEVSRMTDETISSMVQDVTHHRETEIRIITGAVCRLGREHGIATPCNDLMLQLVLAKQSIYLGQHRRGGHMGRQGPVVIGHGLEQYQGLTGGVGGDGDPDEVGLPQLLGGNGAVQGHAQILLHGLAQDPALQQLGIGGGHIGGGGDIRIVQVAGAGGDGEGGGAGILLGHEARQHDPRRHGAGEGRQQQHPQLPRQRPQDAEGLDMGPLQALIVFIHDDPSFIPPPPPDRRCSSGPGR